MIQVGWEVYFFCNERDSAGGAKPCPPTRLPGSPAFTRDKRQVYQLYATLNYGSLKGVAIVAVCKELYMHSPEERHTFLTNIAHLCDMQLGETNDRTTDTNTLPEAAHDLAWAGHPVVDE